MHDNGASCGPGSHPADQAPAGLGAPRFDPSRITEAVELIDPTVLEPLVRKAAEDFYGHVIDAAQDWLCSNIDHNLKSHLEILERENERMRRELYETRRMVGNPLGLHADTLQAIGLLDQKAARYTVMVYAVAQKFEGEERHETALRYIQEREAASGMSAGTAETQGKDVSATTPAAGEASNG